MKKVIFISIIIIFVFLFIICKDKNIYITDNDFLYDEAVKYIIDNDDNPE